MISALAQAGSERSPSIVGASFVSMRTALTFGRIKGGGTGAPPGCIAWLIGASISSEGGLAIGAEPGGAPAGSASPFAKAQTKATLGAIAPHAVLLLSTAPPTLFFVF